MNRVYGLLGFPLSHSFSKRFFTEKFEKEGLELCSYENFELIDIEIIRTIVNQTPELYGLNVTIPYKESIIPFLDDLSPEAQQIGAVNTITISPEPYRKLKGYNTDIIGFRTSLLNLLGENRPSALLMGTGGAAKAVKYVLDQLGIEFLEISRFAHKSPQSITYSNLSADLIKSHKLLINTSPLGMHPNLDAKPEIPYAAIGPDHFLFDLIYNPAETQFLQEGKMRGAQTKNGLNMLEIQAEAAWEIWNKPRI